MTILIEEKTRWLVRYAGKYKRYWLIFGLLGLPVLGLMAFRPFLVRSLVDDVIANRRSEILGLYVAPLFATVALERLGGYFLNFYHARINTLVAAAERQILHARILRAKPQWLAGVSTGDLITRVMSDIRDASSIMGTLVPTLVANVVHLVVICGVPFFLSWKLGLIVAASMPVYYISIKAFGRRLEEAAKEERVLLSKVTESARETFDGALTIKTLLKWDYFNSRFSAVLKRWAAQAIRTWRLYCATQNFTVFITYVTPVVVLGYVGLYVIRDQG